MTDLDNPADPREGWAREHVQRYVATDGADGYWWRPDVPTLLLTTVGRRSGRARRNALIFGRDGEDYLVVASKGGSDTPPDWYVNLTAEPHVRVQVKGERFDATARTATAAEKARMWPVMAAIWPAYDQYQASTDRDIPVVVLTRADRARP